MNFFRLTPDVPGELGVMSQLDTSIHPPDVSAFHLEISNWSGDDLVECFPCYAVTPRLSDALKDANLTGYSIGSMKTTVHRDQSEFDPDLVVPKFRRLFITGESGHDDAGVDSSHELIVSQRLLRILENFNLELCDVSSWQE